MTRLFGELGPLEDYVDRLHFTNNNNNCTKDDPYLNDTTSVLRTWEHSWKEGWTTPGWRKLMNSGRILPSTPWKQFEWKTNALLGSRDFCDASGQRTWYENLYRTPSDWLISPTWDDLQVLMPSVDLQYLVQQAAARISSGGWDALTFLAELKSLRRMMQNAVKRLDALSKLARYSKYYRRYEIRRYIRSASPYNDWLEGRYGWRVLMYDIRDLAEAIQNFKERRSRYKERTGQTLTETASTYSESTSSGITASKVSETSITFNARATVIADIDVPVLQFNPVVTAWEVTKLSFVVDWLVNVGQALEAATFLLMVKEYSSSAGYRADIRSVGTIATIATSPGVTVYSNEGQTLMNGYMEERVPMSVSSIPRLKLRLNEWKVLDLLSLIKQRL